MAEEPPSYNSAVPSVFMKRRLDNASTASIDVVNLNNEIIKMRPKVHAAKLVVVQKLRDRIGKLRKMKGSEKQKELHEKKALERGKEIELIKALGKDYISKYAIGSTANLQSVCSKPGVSLEEIALVRLASHQYVHKMVQEFRAKHEDWKELGAFLMTKQTNREFKKKKKPEELTLQMKQLKKKKAKVRIEASETLVKSYLDQKLKDEGIASESEVVDETDIIKKHETQSFQKRNIDNVSDSNDVNSGESDDEGTENEEDEENNDSDDYEEEEEESVNDESASDSEEEPGYDDDNDNDDEFGDIELGSNSDTDASNDGDSDGYISATNEEKLCDSKSDLEKNFKKRVPETKIKAKKEQKNSTSKDDENRDKVDNQVKSNLFKSQNSKYKINTKSDKGKLSKESGDSKTDVLNKQKAKLKKFEKVQGEVIVKKLNLDEWCNSETNEDDIGKVVLGLTDKPLASVKLGNTKDESVKKVKKKVLDPFFDTGERLFQSRNSEKGELGKNLLAFAGYISDKTEDGKVDDDNDESNNMSNMNDDYVEQFNDYDEIFNEKSRRDGSVYRRANEIGKEAFRTTFMESLNGEEEFFKKKHFKKDHDRFRDRHKEGSDIDFNKRKGLSSGTKAMFKKKGINPTRDSKQEELGSSLLAIAGYQTGGVGSESKIAHKQELWEKKPDIFKKGHKNVSTTNQKKNPSIHPSWEASLKRKQQQSSKIEFTGKKIKFDDD